MESRSRREVFVINSNGRTTVVSGWRAWLALAMMGLVGAVVMVAAAFLLFGLTIALATVLIFVVPLAIAAALAGYLVRALRSR
jgi:hypothetical protein